MKPELSSSVISVHTPGSDYVTYCQLLAQLVVYISFCVKNVTCKTYRVLNIQCNCDEFIQDDAGDKFFFLMVVINCNFLSDLKREWMLVTWVNGGSPKN